MAEERREAKSKGERYIQLNSEFQRIARRDKKAFFSEQGLTIEENTKGERLEISTGKLETSREFSAQRIKIGEGNINSLRYADDTTLTADSKEELKSLLMRVKEDSERASLRLILKTLRSWHPPLLQGK